MKIPWDLETTTLQIKTDSKAGSGEKINVWMFIKDNRYIGGVTVQFTSTIKYWIDYCTSSWSQLLIEPPVDVDKIWTITKTETSLIITCNGVEVVNYLFADSSRISECVPRWVGDVVEQIKFSSDYDTASDLYRAGKRNFHYNTSDNGAFCKLQ